MRDFIAAHALPAALSLLPEKMDSPEARALVLAIGWQESRFKHRRQIKGPAVGWFQFEAGGGVEGVLRHISTTRLAERACRALVYEPTIETVYEALEHNDVLACVFARLLLYAHPDPLPGAGEEDKAWAYYLKQWRPGKPHPETWPESYAAGWGQAPRSA